MHLIIPDSYDPKLSVKDTQRAIRYIRETFQDEFGAQLNLSRLSAPMFVEKSTGLNDNLNGMNNPCPLPCKTWAIHRLKSSTPWLNGSASL